MKERQKTQTELAKELDIAVSTALEHINKLEAADLIEVVPEYKQKKWKYHRLTKTGRKFVEGQRVSIVMLLSYISAALTAGLLIFYLSVPWIVSSLLGTAAPPAPPTTTNATAGSSQIMHAMSDLQTSTGSFLLMLVMLFLLLTVALYAIARFLRSRR